MGGCSLQQTATEHPALFLYMEKTHRFQKYRSVKLPWMVGPGKQITTTLDAAYRKNGSTQVFIFPFYSATVMKCENASTVARYAHVNEVTYHTTHNNYDRRRLSFFCDVNYFTDPQGLLSAKQSVIFSTRRFFIPVPGSSVLTLSALVELSFANLTAKPTRTII